MRESLILEFLEEKKNLELLEKMILEFLEENDF